MPTKISPEGFKIIYWDTMEELVATICERPGLFVGTTHLEKVDAFLYGYEMGLRDAAQRDKTNAEGRYWNGELVAFSIWLCEECFFDTYGDAVGSAAGWSHFLAWLADSDVEAFVFMPVLYHEFTVALQDAGGSRALRDRLGTVELTSEERWALREEEDPEENEDEEDDEEDAEAQAARWKAEREARKAFLRAAAHPLMQKAVEDAAQGVDRPLAAPVAAMRAAREAQKARAAALLQTAASGTIRSGETTNDFDN